MAKPHIPHDSDPQRAKAASNWWQQPAAAGWLREEADRAIQLLGPLHRRQVLQLLPVGLPELELTEAIALSFEQRGGYWQRPVRAPVGQLPVVEHCLDTVIWRYLEVGTADRAALVAEIYRCLRPGGQLLMVSLNPLQPACWRACELRQLGRQALELTWPLRLQGFRTQASAAVGGTRLLHPVRLLLLRKTGDPRMIQPLHDPLLKPVKRSSPKTIPSCRAA